MTNVIDRSGFKGDLALSEAKKNRSLYTKFVELSGNISRVFWLCFPRLCVPVARYSIKINSLRQLNLPFTSSVKKQLLWGLQWVIACNYRPVWIMWRFSEISHRELPFHLIFLPEFSVECFAYRKFNDFRFSGTFPRRFPCHLSPFRNFRLNGKRPTFPSSFCTE